MDNVLYTVPAVHNHQPRTSGGRERVERGEGEGGREKGVKKNKLREEVGNSLIISIYACLDTHKVTE